MIVIGLTGGIATGKSTVSRMLAEEGAIVIDADGLGHDLFHPESEVWQEVVSTFGRDVLQKNDEIDRRKLGEIVFNDPEARKKLNQIMHPRMYRIVEERINNLRKENADVVVLEAALLIEGAWTPLVNEIWVTLAPREVIIRRLMERNGLSEAEAVARLDSQMPPEEKANYADVVIHTDCEPEELRRQVKELWAALHSVKRASRLMAKG